MTPIIPSSAQHRRFWILIAYFFLGYYGCQWVSSLRPTHWTLYLPGERAIPFVAAAIFGYSLSYASMVLFYFLITGTRVFQRACTLAFWTLTIHFACFLLFPFHFERPLITSDDISSLVTRFYYWIDQPYNVFPSLHVAFPFLGALLLWSYKRRWAVIYLCVTALVTVSVVLVKQHYIADTVAALIVTAIVYQFFGGLKRRPDLQDKGPVFDGTLEEGIDEVP